MSCILITHPEVVVDPAAPIDSWVLSSAGRARAALASDLVTGSVRVISSAERKAVETAQILAANMPVAVSVDSELGEMDRSATGYLEPADFETTVDEFFARPNESVRGWERAVDAQRRIEQAVRRHVGHEGNDAVVFVAHGGVGGLLLASLTRAPITRDVDQPGLGSYFKFDPREWRALSPWQRIQDRVR